MLILPWNGKAVLCSSEQKMQVGLNISIFAFCFECNYMKSAVITGRITSCQCNPKSHPDTRYEANSLGRLQMSWAGSCPVCPQCGTHRKLALNFCSHTSPLGILFSTSWRFVKHMPWRLPNFFYFFFFSQREENCSPRRKKLSRKSTLLSKGPAWCSSAIPISHHFTVYFIGYKNGVMIRVPKPCLS